MLGPNTFFEYCNLLYHLLYTKLKQIRFEPRSMFFLCTVVPGTVKYMLAPGAERLGQLTTYQTVATGHLARLLHTCYIVKG